MEELCASFAHVPQTAKIMAALQERCLVKMEKVLNFYKCVHTIYCYNCSILLLVIVFSISMCLIYKLNFIMGISIKEEQTYSM